MSNHDDNVETGHTRKSKSSVFLLRATTCTHRGYSRQGATSSKAFATAKAKHTSQLSLSVLMSTIDDGTPIGPPKAEDEAFHAVSSVSRRDPLYTTCCCCSCLPGHPRLGRAYDPDPKRSSSVTVQLSNPSFRARPLVFAVLPAHDGSGRMTRSWQISPFYCSSNDSKCCARAWTLCSRERTNKRSAAPSAHETSSDMLPRLPRLPRPPAATAAATYAHTFQEHGLGGKTYCGSAVSAAPKHQRKIIRIKGITIEVHHNNVSGRP
ncbi:hypothetical protein B0J12DRAFT_146822 [Macrophomina phaseolina]|uniref:Uncharacterized protein n=1 Tax=Macrophomina phaseolina TaxID=35725 RepID=A0ABQ8G726_9PEZI|nr:hypothetical protein B0J12DRAFT_146822 [Macrophomina phaseolina]